MYAIELKSFCCNTLGLRYLVATEVKEKQSEGVLEKKLEGFEIGRGLGNRLIAFLFDLEAGKEPDLHESPNFHCYIYKFELNALEFNFVKINLELAIIHTCNSIKQHK